MAEEASVAVIVNVAVEPTVSDTALLMSPVPDAAGHEPEPLTEHVHVTPERLIGRVSMTVAPTTSDGPAFETVDRVGHRCARCCRR